MIHGLVHGEWTGDELGAHREHFIPWDSLPHSLAEVGADLGSLLAPCPRKVSLILHGGLRQGKGETGSLIFCIQWSPEGNLSHFPVAESWGSHCGPWCHTSSPHPPLCSPGGLPVWLTILRPRKPHLPSVLIHPLWTPESSELPAWRAPGHQRWESTARLSAAGSRRCSRC